MYTFANSWVLYLLILNLPILYFWWRRRGGQFLFSTLTHISLIKTFSLRRQLVSLTIILRVIAFSCFIIALARPQMLSQVEQVKSDVIDIIITVDTSLSMGAKDLITGSRLEVAKEMIGKFIDARQSDRIGLISFAGYSQLRAPLTVDYGMLKTLLNEIDLVDRRDLKANGTAIGLAIASSVDHLQGSTAKSRIVILLTDGSNNVTTIEPEAAAKIAQVMGVKVYTIGIGTTGMVLMPKADMYAPPNTYELQPSEFNVKVLQTIAQMTGGNSYLAEDRGSLEAIFKDIDKLERTTVNVTKYNRYEEKFLMWVIIGIVALLWELILDHTYLRVLP